MGYTYQEDQCMKNISLTVLCVLVLLAGCNRAKPSDTASVTITTETENIQPVSIDIPVPGKATEDEASETIESRHIQQGTITHFLYDEILTNIDLSFHRDEYQVKTIFGEPVSINEKIGRAHV